MRVRTSEDGNDDIMDLSDALDLAEDTLNQPENEMTATKKEPKAVPAKKAVAKKAAGAEAKASTKKAAAEASKGVFGPREVPEGHTGIAALATELDLTPAAIRRKLRGMEGVAKPEGQHGWYWKDGSKELNAIRKALTPAT